MTNSVILNPTGGTAPKRTPPTVRELIEALSQLDPDLPVFAPDVDPLLHRGVAYSAEVALEIIELSPGWKFDAWEDYRARGTYTPGSPGNLMALILRGKFDECSIDPALGGGCGAHRP